MISDRIIRHIKIIAVMWQVMPAAVCVCAALSLSSVNTPTRSRADAHTPSLSLMQYFRNVLYHYMMGKGDKVLYCIVLHGIVLKLYILTMVYKLYWNCIVYFDYSIHILIFGICNRRNDSL